MNLTISVDDDVLRRAHARANQENTSIEILLQKYLEEYGEAGQHRAEACERVLALSQSSQARRGNIKWAREELYER